MRGNLFAAALCCIGIIQTFPALSATIPGIYHLTLCGGAQQPACDVQTPTVTPPSSDVAQLDGAIQEFYSPIAKGSHVNFTTSGANAAGYIWGTADGEALGLITSFVYKNSSVVCCYSGLPFHITAINDNGIIIG